ncbi:MAG: hypothetical protein ACKVX7_18150 [Planctomycetota bacterium]
MSRSMNRICALVLLALCFCFEIGLGQDFIRGDSNCDGHFDIADVVFNLSGSTSQCTDAADANNDGTVNIADPICMLMELFSGPACIPQPYPLCGLDTGVSLGCVWHTCP